MALESGALAKGAAALLLVGGGGAGAYYGYHHLASKEQKGTSTGDTQQQAPAQTHETTKYDKALITFLNDNGNDIVFDVKKVNGGQTSQNFQVSDLTLTDTTTAAKAEVKITVSGDTATSANLKSGATDATNEKLKPLKDVGNNKSWTWSCVLELKKKTGATKTNLKEADRILTTDNKGLLGILKKELHSYTDPSESEGTKWKKADLKKAKEDFITQCAKERKSKNKEIDEAAELGEQLKVTKTFTFSDETGETSDKKLIAAADSKFDEWFPTHYGTKTYNTGSGS